MLGFLVLGVLGGDEVRILISGSIKVVMTIGTDMVMVGANVPMFYSPDNIHQRCGTKHSRQENHKTSQTQNGGKYLH